MISPGDNRRNEPSDSVEPSAAVRIGAVTYLNARPLTYCLSGRVPGAKIAFDHPSRLAEDLAAGRLDVAMIPSIEYFRHPGMTIISDACIACDGPVLSVRLYSRRPPEEIATLALDEGSRTSAALVRIMLKERFGLEPELCPLPIGAAPEDAPTDAVMVVGDRGMRPPRAKYDCIWDLGEEWVRWTGLPFVFAMWIARPEVDLGGIDRALSEARDEGLTRLEEIARREAPPRGLTAAEGLAYLRDNLRFHLGPRQRQGLKRYYELAVRHDLAPAGATLDFYHPKSA